MGQSPKWEPDSSSASHKIFHILCNLKIHCSLHKRPSFVSVLSRINPFHLLLSYFLKLNLILSSHLCQGLTKVSLSYSLLHKYTVCISVFLHVCYMPHQCHPPWSDHLDSFWCGYISQSSSLCSFLQSLVTSSSLARNHISWPQRQQQNDISLYVDVVCNLLYP
jgi:hypothetical protein